MHCFYYFFQSPDQVHKTERPCMAGLHVGGPTFRYSDFPKCRPSTIFPRLLRCRTATSIRCCNCCVQKGKHNLSLSDFVNAVRFVFYCL